jgi:hypothetical protein
LLVTSVNGRVELKRSEHHPDLQEEDAKLRKLLEETLVEKAKLKGRVSKKTAIGKTFGLNGTS